MEDFGIYIGKIVGTATETDSRVQVRVLPMMDERYIGNEYCPRWPSFFREQLISGKEGDLVWVICDKEFSLGYVIGLANYNTITEADFTSGIVSEFDRTETNFSIPKDLMDDISNIKVELSGKTIPFDNIKVTYWDDNCIHFIERDGGGFIIAYRSGSMFLLRENEFNLKIGDNVFSINDSGMSLKSENIKLLGDYVGLGKNPTANVLTSLGGNSSSSRTSEYVKA